MMDVELQILKHLKRNPQPIISIIDQYCEAYNGIFPEVRSYEWFKDSPYPHIPVRWTMPLMSLPIAAEAGLGMVRLRCFIGDRIPGLQRVPPGKVIPGNPGWVLTLDDLRTTERVRIFMSFIAKAISQKLDLIEGKSSPQTC